MAIPMDIQKKYLWVKHHHDLLVAESTRWIESAPGKLVPAPEFTRDNPVFVLDGATPANLGLIAGDFLQNLRSTLDYLVWQLVLANGKTPKRQAFPICLTPEGYDQATGKGGRLDGIASQAAELIRGLQPAFSVVSSYPHPLHVIDELCNQNKHRYPLLTAFGSIAKPEEPVPFPHVELEISKLRDGKVMPGERIIAFLAFKDGIAERVEVLTGLYALADYVGVEVLPLFDRFFR